MTKVSELPPLLGESLKLCQDMLAEVKRLCVIEREWLMMWATLEELNLVADVRENMALHGWGEEE
mgnify:CR=1 FL=1